MNVAPHLARAGSIGAHALRALRPGVGEVAAVFRRSVYIRSGTAWACIGAADIGAGPLNIVVNLQCDWSTLVNTGEPVKVEADILWVGHVPLALGSASIWIPPVTPQWTPQTIRDGLDMLEELLLLHPSPREGLACFVSARGAPASVEARAAAAPAGALASWFTSPDTERPVVGPLLGLGPGLTPSGDDYLAGALCTLRAIGLSSKSDALWRAISPALADATGAISAAHLESAADGQLSEQQHLILNAILTADGDRLGGLVSALAGETHTSPWDGLAGMVAVLRAVAAAGAPPAG